MEILFLYRAISKHYISDAANDRENLGKHCGKIKMYIVRDLQFQLKYIEIYFLSMPVYAKNIYFKCSLYGQKLYRSVFGIPHTSTY